LRDHGLSLPSKPHGTLFYDYLPPAEADHFDTIIWDTAGNSISAASSRVT
jgi:hypothetical protein